LCASQWRRANGGDQQSSNLERNKLMACPAIDIVVKDVKAALAKVKKSIAEAKGSFSGDEKKGSFSLSGDAPWPFGKYTIDGSYTIEGTTITIVNNIKADSPKIVDCKAVETKLRDWFKGT
jgi:hypothetical protein